MEINNQYDELLIKYLANQLDVEEKVFVENWINSSEDNRLHFQVLKNTWQLAGTKQALDYVLDKLNVDEKWNSFKQRVAGEEGKVVSFDQGGQFEAEYSDGKIVKHKSKVYKILVSFTVAASIILAIGLGVLFFTNNKNEQSIAIQKDKPADSSLLSVIHYEVNTTGKDKRIQLPDGSEAVLSNKSELSYRQPFVNTRDITLIGKAWFKVAKDKTKPFTVVSSDLATTALGTQFTVTALKYAAQITVRLYEGNVVVKAVDKANKRMKKDVYLLPGQELIYGSSIVRVRTFGSSSNVAAEPTIKEEVTTDNPAIPESSKASYFMFNNQSLAKVLDNLAALYNVKIEYNKKELKNIYFTGKYDRTDSLEPILKRIGILNNLTVTKKDSAFIISK